MAPQDPMDPMMRAALLRGLTSRRALVTGALGLGATAALSACGSKGKGTPAASGSAAPSAAAAKDLSDTEKIVNWSNWPEYIDVSDDEQDAPHPRRVHQADRHQGQLHRGLQRQRRVLRQGAPAARAAARTPAVTSGAAPTGWSARLIRQGYVQKLDHGQHPNAANLEPSLKNVEFDPGRVYSLPWQSGFAGIAYNPDATGGKKVESITQLLTDPALKGKVTLLTEMRDTVGLVLLRAGQGPGQLHRRRLRRRHGDAPEGQGRRPDQGLHRQRLHRRPDQGRHRRLRRVDRRRRAAAVRQRRSSSTPCRRPASPCGRTTSSSRRSPSTRRTPRR